MQNLGQEAGLSHQNVMAICQDGDGAIWIGTAAGLNRYDGKQMTTLLNGQFGLRGDSIAAIAKDQFGQIWVGALNGGLSVLDIAQQRFTPVGPADLKVKKLVVSKQGVWAMTKKGLYQVLVNAPLSPTGYKALPHVLPGLRDLHQKIDEGMIAVWQDSLVYARDTYLYRYKSSMKGWYKEEITRSPYKITSLFTDNNLLVGTNGDGLYVVDSKFHKIAHHRVGANQFYQLEPQDIESQKSSLLSYLEQVGSYRAQTESEYLAYLQRLKIPKSLFKSILTLAKHEHSSNIQSIAKVNNRVFICTPELLFCQDNAGLFSKFQDPTVSPSESANWGFQTSMVDANNTLWLGTNRHGIFKVSALEQNLKTYPFAMNCDKCHRRIYTIKPTDHDVFIGLRGSFSLAKFNMATERYQFLGKQDHVACWEVSSILENGISGLYIGGALCGVNNYDLLNPAVNKLKLSDEERLNSWLLQDFTTPGAIWIGTPDKLFHRQQDGFISQYKSLINDEYSFYRGVFFKQKYYWVNKSYNRLHIFDIATKSLKLINLDINGPKGRRLHGLAITGDQLWLATSNGLWHLPLDLSKEAKLVYLTGIKNYQAKSIAKSGDDKLWFTTGNLVARISSSGLIEKMIGASDGLPLHNINSLAIAANGKLILGSDEGLSFLKVPDLEQRPLFGVMLSEVKIGYRSLDSIQTDKLAQPIWSADRITLQTDQHSVAIKFNLPGVDAPSLVQYACKLGETDREWVILGTRNSVNYDYLSPGEYTFMVKARVGTGNWTKPTIITLFVTPKFYQTTWFKLVMVLVGVVGLIIGLKFRDRAQKAYQRTLEHEVANRTRELKQANATLQERAEVIARQHADLERNNQVLVQQRLEILAQRDELAASQQLLAADFEVLSKEANQLKQLIRPEKASSDELSDLAQRVRDIIINNLDNESLGPDQLARDLGLSRTVLYQRFKLEVGKPVAEFIKEIRLQEGARLLLTDKLTVTEIAFKVGFSSYAYFTKCFHEYYGKSPTQFITGLVHKDEELA